MINTITGGVAVADGLNIVGEIRESILDAAYVALLLSGTVKAFAKDVTATGGLTLGMLYRTGADPDTLCVVH